MRPWISLDLETSGIIPEYALQPWRVLQKKSWITVAAWARFKKDGTLDSNGVLYPTPDIIKAILRKAQDLGARIVTWNGTFDIAWLLAYAMKAKDHELEDLIFKTLWLDGMRIWKHSDNTPTYMGKRYFGLKGAVDEHLPQYKNYAVNINYHSRAPADLARLLKYARIDNEAALLLAKKFWEELSDKQRSVVLTEAYAMPHIARANVVGMRVDLDAANKLDAALATLKDTLEQEMLAHGVTEKTVRSPMQMRALLFNKWGLPIVKMNTKKVDGVMVETTPSTDKETLHELAILDDRVQKLGQWREAMNLRTKFVAALQKSLAYNQDGRTHPECILFGTYTSRCTYASAQGRKGPNQLQTGFALHQMKREAKFRSLVQAIDDDHDIVEFDASGQEFRWMAIESGDPVMLGLCEEGEDPHSFMGAQIDDIGYEWIKELINTDSDETKATADFKRAKNARQTGKVGNLSLQYRTSKKKLRIVAKVQYGIPLTEDRAAHIWHIYRKTYVGVPIYWKRQIMLGKSQGWIENLAGRRVKIEGDWQGEYAWSMESTCINFPIQGIGGDQKYLAIRVLSNFLNKYDAKFAWDLHDGLYFYVPRNKSKKFGVEMRQVLNALPYKRAWGLVPPIPLPWDCKIGPSWGALKELRV